MGLFDFFFGGPVLNDRPPRKTEEQSKVEEILETATRLGLTLTKDEAVQLMTGRLVVMTPEQQNQWYKLTAERYELIKKLKVDSFKALPASIRQYIIDSITWTSSMDEINSAYLDPLPEERAFEQLAEKYEMLREVTGGQSMRHSWGRPKSSTPDISVFTVEGGSQYATIRLNEQMIPLKQLVDAHAEQCIADGITGDLNK